MLEVVGIYWEGMLRLKAQDFSAMNFVPGGEYLVGISAENAKALSKEGLTFYSEFGVRNVTIEPFHMRVHLVSVREFLEFISSTNGEYGELCIEQKGLDFPVSGVSCIYAQQFAKWKGGRLPSAVEWEIAARGTDELVWNGLHDLVKLPRSAGLRELGSSPKLVSRFGIQELYGYLAEWTSDKWQGNAIVKGYPYNAHGPFHLSEEACYGLESQPFNVGFRYVID